MTVASIKPERRGVARTLAAVLNPCDVQRCECHEVEGGSRRCLWHPRPCLRSPTFLEDAAAYVVRRYERLNPVTRYAYHSVDPAIAEARNVHLIHRVLTEESLMPEQRAAVVELGLHLLGVAHALTRPAQAVGDAIVGRTWGFVSGKAHPKRIVGVGTDLTLGQVAATSDELSGLLGDRADCCRRAWRRVAFSCHCAPDLALAAGTPILSTPGAAGWRCCRCYQLHRDPTLVCHCGHIRGSTAFYTVNEPDVFPVEHVWRSTASCCFGWGRPCDFCSGQRCRHCSHTAPCKCSAPNVRNNPMPNERAPTPCTHYATGIRTPLTHQGMETS